MPIDLNNQFVFSGHGVDQAVAINITDEVLEACKQFHQLAGIPIALRSIQMTSQIKSTKNLKFVFVGLSGTTDHTLQLAAATEFRIQNPEYSGLPVLCFGESPLDAFKYAADDYEFVSYLAAPFVPAKYLEAVRSVVTFTKSNEKLLEKRLTFSHALSKRDFKLAAKLHGELVPLYNGNRLQHRLLKVQYFNKLCDQKGLYLELKQTLIDFPKSLKTREMWTVLLDQVGRLNELKAALAEGLKLYPQHPSFLALEGDLYLSSGNLVKAEISYSKASELQPTLNEPKWGLLLTHYIQPKKNFGRDLLGEVDIKSKKFLKYCDRRFKALASQNKWHMAASLMHGLLRERRVNSTEHLRWMNFAVALLRSGDREKAIDALRKCLAMAPPGYTNATELLEKILADSFSNEMIKVVDL